MHLLLLGANGYIGSKIAHEYVSSNCELICPIRSSSDTRRLVDINSKISVIDIAEINTNLSPDILLNCVCNYGKNEDTDAIYEANYYYPKRIFEVIGKKKLKKVVTIGSGLPKDFNSYTKSKKKFADFGCDVFAKYGIDFFEVNPEMFYGFDEPAERFLPSIIRKMLLGYDVETTLGTQHRDVIRADDVINAIIAVLNSDWHGCYSIPVGTGVAPTISEIVDYIWYETGERSRVYKGSIPMRSNEPDCIADTSIMSELCDWHPVFWKNGIKDMIGKISLQMQECNE